MKLHTLQDQSLPPSLYEATATRADYPALIGEVTCDVCVVGGGLLGLHTALGAAASGASVVLLEAQRIGWGASGRNGGHLIPEFSCGMAKLETALGETGAMRAWQIVRGAAQEIRSRIRRHQIDCDQRDGHIEVAIAPRHADRLHQWHEHARARYGAECRLIDRSEMKRYVGSDRYVSGLLDMDGGHLHPLKFCIGLARALQESGGQVFEGSAVLGWQADGDGVRVETEAGTVRAKRLVLCANVGMASFRTPLAQRLAKRILPVGTWMIATEPLSEQLAQSLLPTNAAVCDNRFVLDYFRLDRDNRLAFGGGCSYLGMATPQGFAAGMQRAMTQVFPQLSESRIDYAWGGVIDITQKRMPDLGCDESGRVIYAQGFSGSGVVATMAVADILTRALGGDKADFMLFQRISQKPFPGGEWLRGPLTAAGMFWYRFLDHALT